MSSIHLSHAVVPKQNILSSRTAMEVTPPEPKDASRLFRSILAGARLRVCKNTILCNQPVSQMQFYNNFYQASSESTKASPHKIDLHVATKDLGKKVDFSSRGFHFVFINAVELMTQTGCAWQKKLVGLSCRTRGRHCTACKKILC